MMEIAFINRDGFQWCSQKLEIKICKINHVESLIVLLRRVEYSRYFENVCISKKVLSFTQAISNKISITDVWLKLNTPLTIYLHNGNIHVPSNFRVAGSPLLRAASHIKIQLSTFSKNNLIELKKIIEWNTINMEEIITFKL